MKKTKTFSRSLRVIFLRSKDNNIFFSFPDVYDKFVFVARCVKKVYFFR